MVKVRSLILLTLSFLGVVQLGFLRAESAQHSDDRKEIRIFSDANDADSVVIASQLYQVLEKFYHNVRREIANSLQELDSKVGTEALINVYVFRGSLTGLWVGSEIVSWERMAQLLNQHRTFTFFGPVSHVLAPGNGDKLEALLNRFSGFHVETSPVIDARLSFFFDLWTIAEVLSSRDQNRTHEMLLAGEYLKKAASAYFEKDLNSLISAVISPKDPLGEPSSNDPAKLEGLSHPPEIVQTYPTATTPADKMPAFSLGNWLQNRAPSPISFQSNIVPRAGTSQSAATSRLTAVFDWKMHDRYGLDQNND